MSNVQEVEEHPRPHPQRRTSGAILVLVGIAGYFDAISYLGLGHVFTANMTGNTALLALSIGQRDLSAVLRYLCALGGFCLGILIGALLVGQAPPGEGRTRALRRAGTGEGILLLTFAVLWLANGTKPTGNLVLVLLGLASMAMGFQSVVVRGFGFPGIGTTALTSPMATLMTELAKQLDVSTHAASPPPDVSGPQANRPVIGRLAAVWLIYGLAALVGGIAITHFPAAAVFLPLIALVPVILVAFKR